MGRTTIALTGESCDKKQVYAASSTKIRLEIQQNQQCVICYTMFLLNPKTEDMVEA